MTPLCLQGPEAAPHRELVIHRGELYWVDLGEAVDHRPARRPPVLVIQADAYNRSRLATVLAAVVTSTTDLGRLPGNLFLPAAMTGLPRDSVVNVTAVVSLDRAELEVRAEEVPPPLMREVDVDLRRVFDL